jgi:superfamily I DNA/RNA helicase
MLNEEQELVRTSTSGTLIVHAGPGSGKTQTIVGRVAWLARDQKIPPGGIMLVRHDNKRQRFQNADIEYIISFLAEI